MCKQFFLHTLGYKHDTVLTKLFKSMTPSKIRPPGDQRGKHIPKHAFTPEILAMIDDHIESFHPETSHYRRAHAPLLHRYLPPELTITMMSKLFEEDHPGVCSRRSYAGRVKAKNVSFCKLGEEECEVCEAIVHHACSAQNLENSTAPQDDTEELATRFTR